MNLPPASERDYDYTSYICQCAECSHQFYGPKRSYYCKLCLNKSEKEVDTLKENV
jgi:hypothetical protein